MAESSQKYTDAAVQLLKANLGYYGNIPDEVEDYLRSLLEYSHLRLAQTADIHLNPGNLYDDQLQVMYAAYLYRKGGEGAEKPPMLKETIRDYQVGKVMAEGSV